MDISNLFKHYTLKIFSPSSAVKRKYGAFKELLENDKRAHELMAELEEIYYDQKRVDFKIIETKYHELASCVSTIIDNLIKMSPKGYSDLKSFFKKIDNYIRFMIEPPKIDEAAPFTVSLKDITEQDYILVGGKAFNLSKIAREIELKTPPGFVITTKSFNEFIEFNNLRKFIDEKLICLDIKSSESLDIASKEIISKIEESIIPPEVEKAINKTLASSTWGAGKDVRLAVRSSAVGEDSRSSFAGQYKTLLNVRPEDIVSAYREVIASKYSPRALYYRVNYGLSDEETPMAVLVLEMINALSSGVMYTIDVEEDRKDMLTIHSTWGLGELLVSGEVSPDTIKVIKADPLKITEKKIASKKKQMVYSDGESTKIIDVDKELQTKESIDDTTALTLASYGIQLEKFYGEPQDVEWALDHSENLYILQSRLLKVDEVEERVDVCTCETVPNRILLSGGDRACSGIAAGKVYKVKEEKDIENMPEGAVLVARNASPHYVKVMDRLSAVVTDMGSTAGHFASVAREFGVPTLVNTGNATEKLEHDQEVTVYAGAKLVYEGIVQALLECPCAQRNLLEDSPFIRKLRYIINFISPLKMTDPEHESFKVQGVRSIHDIIRFAHEKAVQEMFLIGNKRIRKLGGAKKLTSKIPMFFYVLDVGGGLKPGLETAKTVTIEDVVSRPMKAVFKGLSHPGIKWGDFTHFDWGEYDKIVMSGGIISPESSMFASYAIVSEDYLNLNLRFGYHFVIVDTMCGDKASSNYILFRFSGGGADFYQRSLRAEFLKLVLSRLGFKVDTKLDLVDGQLKGETQEKIEEKLDIIGRLLGATRLMDMYMKDAMSIDHYVDEFMNGKYHFATLEDLN